MRVNCGDDFCDRVVVAGSECEKRIEGKDHGLPALLRMREIMKNRRKQPKRAGFTLVEMMIATTILGVGLLGVAMMQLHALQQGSQG